MLIKGLQKTTLLDFPGKVACTVFTGGCNFRCPFCHNASLVTRVKEGELFTESEIFSFLERRRKILDGVCITGGEPLLQPDLHLFCQKLHELGLLVKLDTNGSFPKQLQALIEAGLVDYIAMDIKNSKEEYARTCGISAFPEEIETSLRMIMNAGIPYEFRTTVTREFHSSESMAALAHWIKGANQYFLQAFIDSGDLIEPGLSAYSADEMERLLMIVRRDVPSARLRGM